MEERVSSLETKIRDPNSVLNVNCLLVSDVHIQVISVYPPFPHRVNTRMIFKSVLLNKWITMLYTIYCKAV